MTCDFPTADISTLHRYCYWSQQDVLRARLVRTRIVISTRSRAPRVCDQHAPRVCVRAHTHPRTRTPPSSPQFLTVSRKTTSPVPHEFWDWIHSHTPPRTCSPSSRHPPLTHYPFPPRSLVCGGQPNPHKSRLVVSHRTCPPLSSSPHAHSFVIGPAVINTHTIFGHAFGGLWGAHEQYLSDLWSPGHAVLCVWKPERRYFTHTKSHARLPSVSTFFRSHSEISRPYMWGVGLTQQSRHPPPRSLVCGGQPSQHKPRLVVSHSTCPPLSSSPHAHSCVIGPAGINTPQHAAYTCNPPSPHPSPALPAL